VRSNPGFKTLALAAAGVCRPGDRFFLATDAVAARLFKSAALGPGPEWERLESLDMETWRTELDALRKANDMVNDDCTLVALRVAGGVRQETGDGGERTEDREQRTEETGDRRQESEDSERRGVSPPVHLGERPGLSRPSENEDHGDKPRGSPGERRGVSPPALETTEQQGSPASAPDEHRLLAEESPASVSPPEPDTLTTPQSDAIAEPQTEATTEVNEPVEVPPMEAPPLPENERKARDGFSDSTEHPV
jgi:hypothetical protein